MNLNLIKNHIMCNFIMLLCKSTDSSIKLATVMRSDIRYNTSIWLLSCYVSCLKSMLC